ncbi:hypothetical protein GALL_464120 [mine drainage metagenome]|uniref:Uncharacterized protein n=1 Tax=mine drainage metagenome TaxID=410659 RepID=A0A1J5PVY4_9ZZZZ
MPPPQQIAAIKPALRGPARSSQPPQIAAEMPKIAMNVSNTCTSTGTLQLQVVLVSASMNPNSPQLAGALVINWLIGFQNTENP